MTQQQTGLTTVKQGQITQFDFSTEQIDVIRNQIARGASDAQMKYFLNVCKSRGLNPILNDIYCVVPKDPNAKMIIMLGIDGLRKIALNSNLCEGYTKQQWCGDDGIFVDVWTKKEKPIAGQIAIYRKGFREPTWGIAYMDAYFAGDKEQWRKNYLHMIIKVATSMAIKAAFPENTSGFYISEEMDQARNKNEQLPVEYIDSSFLMTDNPEEMVQEQEESEISEDDLTYSLIDLRKLIIDEMKTRDAKVLDKIILTAKIDNTKSHGFTQLDFANVLAAIRSYQSIPA